MGKIIRNGVPYSGTYDNAHSVNYDNSVSGLNARTVQEGIDELGNNLGGLRFGYDGDSNKYGYYGADDSFIPFKSGGKVIAVTVSGKDAFDSAWTVDLGVNVKSFMWYCLGVSGISWDCYGVCHGNIKKVMSKVNANAWFDLSYTISGTKVTFPAQSYHTFKSGATIYFFVATE